MKAFLEKFFVQAVTNRVEPQDEELYRWLAQVQDSDHAFLALRELLSRHLLTAAATAGSLQLDDTTKLRACERLEFARMFLLEFETKREEAKAWRQAQEEQRAGK